MDSFLFSSFYEILHHIFAYFWNKLLNGCDFRNNISCESILTLSVQELSQFLYFCISVAVNIFNLLTSFLLAFFIIFYDFCLEFRIDLSPLLFTVYHCLPCESCFFWNDWNKVVNLKQFLLLIFPMCF